MTKEEADYIGGMNMCDEISNEAYRKIMCHCEEQEPKTDTWSIKDVADTLAKHGLIAEQEPCEDAVSRKELLKIYEDRFLELQKLKHLKDNKGLEDRQLGVNYCINILKELPSVNPQKPKCETAKWIRRSGIMSWKWFECDRCTTGNDFATPYCPHCGAKMSEIPTGSESEE